MSVNISVEVTVSSAGAIPGTGKHRIGRCLNSPLKILDLSEWVWYINDYLSDERSFFVRAFMHGQGSGSHTGRQISAP